MNLTTRFSKYLLVVAVTGLLALLVAGCGSSSDDGSAPAPSKAAATETADDGDVATASDVQRDAYDTEFRAIGPKMDAVGDKFIAATDVPSFTAARVELQGVIAEINAMNPPDDIEADHTRMYAALRRALVETKKITESSTEASDTAAAAAAGEALDEAGSAVDAISAKLD